MSRWTRRLMRNSIDKKITKNDEQKSVAVVDDQWYWCLIWQWWHGKKDDVAVISTGMIWQWLEYISCWAVVSKWTRWLMSSVTADLMWWAEMMSSVDDVTEIAYVWWHDYGNTSILYCKSKLVLLLRLGYPKPFLAGSKKTRQGPIWRVGALCISRC